MKLCGLRFLPFSLLSVLIVAVSGETAKFTNSSSSSSPATDCDKCTVTAFEQFHTYPFTVEVEEITATQVVVPMVTVHPDGSSETNYVTETPKPDPTAPHNESPQPTDPYASLTWEIDNVTLTYPTTYVQFIDLSGGTFFAVTTVPTPTCTFEDEPLQLPPDSATGLIVPVTQSIDLAAPTAVSAPPAVHSYLNAIPAVSSQFDGTDVAICQWTKIPATATSPHATLTATGAAPVQKVSVSVLTEVTANQVIITPAGNGKTTSTPTPAVAHVEDTGTILVAPAGNTQQANGNQQTAQPQQQSGSQSTPGVGGAIANIINPGSSNGGTQPASGQSTPGSGSGSNGGSGSGSVSGGTQSGGQGSQPNGQGGSALPSPLVITLGGTQTTIAPTVIPNAAGTGSVTAFVLGAGSTLIAGGSPITISGSIVSAPKASSTTEGVGDAIASGLGYTGPLATGLGNSLRGPNLPMWVLGVAAGAFGALAVGL